MGAAGLFGGSGSPGPNDMYGAASVVVIGPRLADAPHRDVSTEALAADSADEALAYRVGFWAMRRRFQYANAKRLD